MVKKLTGTKVVPVKEEPGVVGGKNEKEQRRKSVGGGRRQSSARDDDDALVASEDVPGGGGRKNSKRRGTVDGGVERKRRKSSAAKDGRHYSVDNEKKRMSKTEKELEDARKLLLLREEEKEKRREIRKQKQEKQLEKELKKKLAYHHVDKDEVQDSEESIYIAPPAPENHISIIATITQLAILFIVVTLWPMGFAKEFHVESEVDPWIGVMFSGLQPVISLVWLILVIFISKKKKICCCRNRNLWFLRGHFLYSPVLLVLPLFFVITYILYVGRLDLNELERTMFIHLNLYDAKQQSKNYWDTTQEYFQCCGVNNEGWRNWEQREKVDEYFVDWIVPRSCCRTGVDYIACVNETMDELVWNKGCLYQAYAIFVTYGNLVICTLVANTVLSCASVYFSTKYYLAIRLLDDPTFEFHLITYFMECWCCCRCGRPVTMTSQ